MTKKSKEEKSIQDEMNEVIDDYLKRLFHNPVYYSLKKHAEIARLPLWVYVFGLVKYCYDAALLSMSRPDYIWLHSGPTPRVRSCMSCGAEFNPKQRGETKCSQCVSSQQSLAS